MGILKVDLEIINLADESRHASFSGAAVDSGSALTWIPEQALLDAGISVRKRGIRFATANGQIILRDVGFAILKCGEFECADEVVFAQPGDPRRIGSRTLDGFNARVNLAEGQLAPAEPLPAARIASLQRS